MDFFVKFRNGYFAYFLGVIIPAIINALSIPLFKRILGAETFGKYSIFANAVFIVAYFLFGWIFQAVLRFYSTSHTKLFFYNGITKLSYKAILLFFIPIIVVVYFFFGTWVDTIFFSLCMAMVAFQILYMSFAQASLSPSLSTYAEIIRSIGFIGIAMLITLCFDIKSQLSLIISLLVSYLLSYIFLKIAFSSRLENVQEVISAKEQSSFSLREILGYGLPLSFWFLVALLSSFVDKVFMAKALGHGVQGNYQATFDLINKSITMIMAPVLTSVFPLLTIAYKDGDRLAIIKLKRRIILYEIAGYLLISFSYWTFGGRILFDLIDVTCSFDYLLAGFFVITSSFVWQVALLVHKKYELQYQTSILLTFIIISIIAQIVFYFSLASSMTLLVFPIGNLLFSVIYLILVSLNKYPSFLSAGLIRNPDR